MRRAIQDVVRALALPISLAMADQWERHSGTPGASARREAERQREARELGGSRKRISRLLANALGPSVAEKRSLAREKAFTTGGRGEEMLAESLARRCPEVALLHDRQLRPGGRANIDHLAVASSGIYVIDTKRYRGRIEVRKPWFRDQILKIDGRDKTNLVDGLERQVAAVRAASADVAPDVPVHGCLCFMAPEGFLASSGLPLIRTLKIRGYPLLDPRRLAKLLGSSGPMGADQAAFLFAELARRFPAASA
jgi:hypothetical protein